jgi:hypothetical protein
MSDQQQLDAIARAIVDANLYMVLGTADSDGQPWVSPVFYAAGGYRDFYWVSSPEAAHSRNLARRPQISVVIFDSQVPAYSGQAVYMTATAEELAGDELDRGLEVYPGPPERGARTLTAAELRPPAPYRLYRATASQHWILGPEPGLCPVHGRPADHRAAVTP